jgi:hypothetical protein
MNALQNTIARQGSWFKNQCDVIAEHPLKDVVEYFYSPAEIDQYLIEKKAELTINILSWFKSYKILIWKETGMPVLTDKDFFELYLEFNGPLRSFKAALDKDKFTATQLAEFNYKLYHNDTFINTQD